MKDNFFVRRPLLSIVISLMITLLGILAIQALPIALYPELTPPRVTVNVNYPGASAQTIADTVLTPLETQINGVESMLYMNSHASSASGSGTISIYFDVGTDPDIALVNVNNTVNLAQNLLPEEVRRQGIRVRKSSPAVLMRLAIISPDMRYDQVFLANYLQNNIVDELKRVKGVGDCTIFEDLRYTMRIWLNPDKMAYYNLVPNDIGNAIREQNTQFTPGQLGASPARDDVDLTWQIDTKGRLLTPEEFGNIILRTQQDSSFLRIKDVARVEISGRNYSVNSKYNGQITSTAGIFLLPGANALETGKLIEEKLQSLAQRFPEGLEYRITNNTNAYVDEAIKEVLKTLLETMILVFLIVFLFLQSWRATLIACLAVPVSIIGTFAGMYALGYSLNTLTLFGLVLSIGIVVDDAIVVLENVERIMRTEHKNAQEATIKAMQQVTGPVIAIVLVLCAVFIPVSFMGGFAGEMYKQFAITISISVIISGIVALTLTPALCAMLLQKHDEQKKSWRFFTWFNYKFTKITHGYVRIARSIKNVGLRSNLMFLMMLIALGFLFRTVPTSLVPDEDQGYLHGMVILADGATQKRTEEVLKHVEQSVLAVPYVENLLSLAGLDATSFSIQSNYGSFYIRLHNWGERPEKHQSPDALAQIIRGLSKDIPEASIVTFKAPPVRGLSSTGGFVGFIQSTGTATLQELEQWAKKVADKAKQRSEIGSVRNLFSTGAPQFFANLDRELAKVQEVNIDDVFAVMQANFGSSYINDFNYGGRTYQVVLQADTDYRMTPNNLSDLFVRNNKGEMIPLNALITLERRVAPQTVTRFNVFPAAQIIGAPAVGFSSGQAIAAMEEVASEVLPLDYSLGWAGTALQEKLTSSDTLYIFLLALLMVFLILTAQYESLALPLAVLTAVPFGVFGAILAAWIRGFANDIYFQVALVTLVGLAAKNAILIVEFAAASWRSGKNLDVAAMQASRLRFRPIIMTSLAFIIGCIPLAISSGAGANSRQALGTAVIGGMLAATCIATLFIPYFFKLIMKLSLRMRGKSDCQHKN